MRKVGRDWREEKKEEGRTAVVPEGDLAGWLAGGGDEFVFVGWVELEAGDGRRVRRGEQMRMAWVELERAGKEQPVSLKLLERAPLDE
jgi:hypothetical protein